MVNVSIDCAMMVIEPDVQDMAIVENSVPKHVYPGFVPVVHMRCIPRRLHSRTAKGNSSPSTSMQKRAS
jgi:hypothetical protein